jgi:hypothetical protein
MTMRVGRIFKISDLMHRRIASVAMHHFVASISPFVRTSPLKLF